MSKSKCSVCQVPCTRVCICGNISYCSINCQKEDWSGHKENCPTVSVRDLGDKGRGLVTNRRISVGQVILEEKPMMLVNFKSQQCKPYREVLSQFKKLSREQKSSYLELSYQGRGGANKIMAIFTSNCVFVEDKNSEDDWRGIFCRFSMTNHSCAPNCVINYDSDKNMKLVASRNIHKGEEVVVNYLDPCRRRKVLLRFERMRLLKNLWNFSCCCKICTLTGQQLARNEEMKRNINNLESKQEQFRNVWNMKNAMNCLTLEHAIVNLMGKLGDEMTREVPLALMRCYQFGRVLQVLGNKPSQNPENFRKSAMDIAKVLGESYVRRIRKTEEEVDIFISEATKTLVEEKKIKMLKNVRIYIWNPEIKSENKS